MRWHGVGSANSPIVISDDEDETMVERALEFRLSDPQDEDDLEPFDYGADDIVTDIVPIELPEVAEDNLISGALQFPNNIPADRFELWQI